MSQWVNGSVDGSMGRMGPGSMGQWVMGLGYDGSDGSWVTNGDPWSTLIQTISGYKFIRDCTSTFDVRNKTDTLLGCS